MFEDFDEWFAIRNGHSDDDIWAGRLSFSTEKGIVLESICFPDGGSMYDAPKCDTGTITGYLDYQRPTTLIEPWVQSRGGGSIGVDTPLVRAKSRILAGALLKNIHLTDPSEKCFTELHMDMPSFGAWYAPDLVNTDFEFTKDTGPAEVSVAIGRPILEEFRLKDNTEVSVQSFAGASSDNGVTTVSERTWLTVGFPEAIRLKEVRQRIWRLNTLFSFLLGHRMAQNPYNLKSTHTRRWNDSDKHVTAQLIFRPVFESMTHHVEWHDALFKRNDCSLSPQAVMDAATVQSNALFYLMNIVLLQERPTKLSANDFVELLGCIEDFDIKTFGGGPSKGSERLTLAMRLDRLQRAWEDCGFRAKPISAEIVKLRRDIAHGRAVNLSSEDYQRIGLFTNYLCALSRFHVFRTLGISASDIGKAFRRVAYMYGKYAPLDENEE